MIYPLSTEALEVAVTAAQAGFAAQMSGDVRAPQIYMLVSSTNCWFKQGSPTATIVCDANAAMADGDIVTINDGINAAVIYEYDKTGNGVTGGRVVWTAGTTAATVATNLAAAINASPPNSSVSASAVGATVTVTSTVGNLTTTKTSASAMTVAFTPQATAGAGSMYLPANTIVTLSGIAGTDVSIIRDSADGKATLVRCLRY